MNIQKVLDDLDQKINALKSARDFLAAYSRPTGKKKTRHMSAAGRRKISLAQKKRWAEQKKQG